MKKEYDFSKGERGKFFRPGIELNIPIYLEPDVARAIRQRAEKQGVTVHVLVNDALRKSMVAESPSERYVQMGIHNTGSRDYYLPLGTMGSDVLAIRLVISSRGSLDRNVMRVPVRSGVGPSRIEPIIVPLLSESTYAIRYPISQLYYVDTKREPLDGSNAKGKFCGPY